MLTTQPYTCPCIVCTQLELTLNGARSFSLSLSNIFRHVRSCHFAMAVCFFMLYIYLFISFQFHFMLCFGTLCLVFSCRSSTLFPSTGMMIFRDVSSKWTARDKKHVATIFFVQLFSFFFYIYVCCSVFLLVSLGRSFHCDLLFWFFIFPCNFYNETLSLHPWFGSKSNNRLALCTFESCNLQSFHFFSTLPLSLFCSVFLFSVQLSLFYHVPFCFRVVMLLFYHVYLGFCAEISKRKCCKKMRTMRLYLVHELVNAKHKAKLISVQQKG